MKFSQGQAVAIGVAIAVGLQLIVVISAWRSASAYFQAAADRRVAYRTLQASSDFQSLIKDAETGQRGYLLTSDPQYLQPLEAADRGLPAAFQELRETSDDSHATELAEIEKYTELKMEEIRGTVTLVRNDAQNGKTEALKIVRGNSGKNFMDKIRTLASAIDQAELSRADDLSARMDSLARGTMTRVLQLSLASIFLVTLAGILMYRDLQRRIKAEAGLQEQTSILRSVLDSMSDGVYVANTAGEMTMVNAAARRMQGLDAPESRMAEWSNYYRVFELDRRTPFPFENLPLVRALRGEIVDNSQIYTQIPRSALPPSHESLFTEEFAGELPGIYLDINGRPIYDDKGTLRGGVIVSRDITLQKLAEMRVLSRNEELDRRVKERTAELAISNAELQQKNQENEMFVYSVSHDLRSPLVNLQGFSQELQVSCNDLRALLGESDIPEKSRKRGMQVLDGDITQAVKFIQSAVTRLANIINALLRLSRAGRVEYQRKPVPLRELINDIVASRHNDITNKNVQVEVQPLPTTRGDSSALEQLFSNLIDNAVKYIDPARPGKIVIGMNSDESNPAVRTVFVRDNGLGIPEQGREKVFKAFERLHPHVASGEGMGLAIVARIVERHGGTIRVESQVGEGSTFYVELPIEDA